jgi:hypothetical protein
VVGFTIDSREEVPEKTCEKRNNNNNNKSKSPAIFRRENESANFQANISV